MKLPVVFDLIQKLDVVFSRLRLGVDDVIALKPNSLNSDVSLYVLLLDYCNFTTVDSC